MRPSVPRLASPLTALSSALTAIVNPTRADAVAALGETTGAFALEKMLMRMKEDNAQIAKILHDTKIYCDYE